MKNQQRIGLLMVCLLVVSAAAAISVTPAGTRIQATGTAQYYSTSGNAMPPGSSNVVTTTVMQIASVSLTPTVDTKQGSSGGTVDFPLTAKNTGNGSDTFDLSVGTQNGSTVTIYKDANGDGIRQSSETTIITSTGALAAGGTFNCIASAKLPSSGSADVVTVTAKSRFDSTKTSKSTLTIQAMISSAYVTSWLVNGTYPNTDRSTLLSTAYISGETTVNPTEGGMSGGKPWIRFDSPTNYADLSAHYGAPTYCAAYACAYVYSPSAQTVNMWVGSDDGIKIWLNGAVVWTNNAFRAYTMDSDKTTVSLPAGYSKLLVKVSQTTGAWGFSVKFCDSQGNAVAGMQYDTVPAAPPADYYPTFSNIKATPSSTSAIVEWDTDMLSDSMVEYWNGNDYQNYGMKVDWTLVSHHSITLVNLTPGMVYNLYLSSATSRGLVNSEDFTVTTLSGGNPPPAPTGAYNRTWLLNGAYPNATQATRLSTDYIGGESGVNPSPGSVSGGKTWFRIDSTADYVDMNAAFGTNTYCAGYAFAYVYSPSVQTANVWMGSDDGIKVWLNGAVIWTNDASRAFTIDKDKMTVTLPAGWSRLLVKISQNTSTWGFSFKFCDSSGNALPGVTYALAPAGSVDTTAPVISNIKITPSTTSSVIEWDTNEAADTMVDYGTTSSLGTPYSDTSLATHHSATLSGLAAGTTYYFKAGSADSSGNTAWQGTYTFQTTAVPPPSSGPYVMSWLINGIYKNSRDVRMTTDYLAGEAMVTPTGGMISGGNTWTRLDSTKSYIDLKTPFNSPTGCAGYAFAYVYSPVAQSANLWMGSDDGIKVWLNGSLVWNNDIYRSMALDVDKTTVNLKAGWNRLLVKVTQADQGWGFSLRLCDSSGNALPGVTYALAPAGSVDTTAPVISNIKITPSSTSSVIEWDTNEAADTMVDYGTTSSLGTPYSDESLATHHSATLSGLSSGTTYYFKVGSADSSGNTAWQGTYTFQTTAVPPPSSSPYVMSWLINGIYKNSRTVRMSTDYLGGEASVTPTEGIVSGGNTWTRLDSTKSYIDLKTPFNSPTGCAGYAFAYVYSPVAQSANLWMGSDDGIKVWLNGSLVWNNDIYRSMALDVDKTTVNLKAGWNRLLVKVTQADQGWGFSLRLCDSAGNALPGIAISVAP